MAKPSGQDNITTVHCGKENRTATTYSSQHTIVMLHLPPSVGTACILTSEGKQPVILSFIKINSFKVLPIFPMLPGMQPPRLLFAITKIEIGEFPRFSEIPNRICCRLRKIPLPTSSSPTTLGREESL
ncbi:Ig kappa chain V-VI region NQ2-6.1 [Forsythia ovata]|uniref:Ig kappa chain V-VI region NQ2-6.1 n=1 Tax=Forsythia ovata TaxID=205694 RepID=A0ABD1VEX0_9LAMI